MKKIVILALIILGALTNSQSYSNVQSINITAFECNSEIIRDKNSIEQCAQTITDDCGWEEIVNTHSMYTNNGLVVTLYTDNGSVTIHCLNKKNMILIDIMRIKGKCSYLHMKNIIKNMLQAARIKISLSTRD